jgi:hypothetical protein
MTMQQETEIIRLNKEINGLLCYIEFLEQNRPVEEVHWNDMVALFSNKAVKAGRSIAMADGFIYEEDIDE